MGAGRWQGVAWRGGRGGRRTAGLCVVATAPSARTCSTGAGRGQGTELHDAIPTAWSIRRWPRRSARRCRRSARAVRRAQLDGVEDCRALVRGQLESYLFSRLRVRSCARWSAAGRRPSPSGRGLSRARRTRRGAARRVVIQQMISGRVSGVLFTAHPVSGRRDQALLTAAWGQGEGIVGGACNTTNSPCRRRPRAGVRIADKDLEVVPDPAGLGHHRAAGRRGAPEAALPDQRRGRAHVREGVRIAPRSAPPDIEWPLDGDRLYLLQARPITCCRRARRRRRRSARVWNNSNIQESYCGLTTPLTFSVRAAPTPASTSSSCACWIARVRESRRASRCCATAGLVRGRVYYNINTGTHAPDLAVVSARTSRTWSAYGARRAVDFVEGEKLGFLDKARRRRASCARCSS